MKCWKMTATTTQATKYAEEMLRCQELAMSGMTKIDVDTHITRADLRHPIASKWAVSEDARSEVMLPGSCYQQSFKDRRAPHLIHNAQEDQEVRKHNQRSDSPQIGCPLA